MEGFLICVAGFLACAFFANAYEWLETSPRLEHISGSMYNFGLSLILTITGLIFFSITAYATGFTPWLEIYGF